MRSYLYVPAANQKMLKKSVALQPDVLIFDLEDSAAPAQKQIARAQLAEHLAKDFSAKSLLVRINSANSSAYDDDLAMIASLPEQAIQGVILPKVDGAAEIEALDIGLRSLGVSDALSLWAMVETPLAVLHADQLAAASPRLEGFILGLEDLSTKLGGIHVNADRSNISYAMQRVVMAAKAFDMVAIDAVCMNYQDDDALKAHARYSRDLGYDGKSLIHPDQIEPVNQIFGVSQEELDAAHAVIDAFEAAEAKGEALATLNGVLIEALHVEAAKKTALTYRAQNQS